MGLAGADRVEIGAVVAATLAVALHQLLLAGWWVEDAAISFAYARHLATGEGLVPYPGAERVEGFSNPLWVLILALPEAVGLEAAAAAKGLQVALGAGAVPVLWDAARRVAPGRLALPLLIALALAADPQHAIWGASGLENALWTFLVAVGLRGVAAPEARFSGALAWGLLAVTRPEGAALAGIGAAWTAVGRRYALAALALAAAPGLGWLAFREAYFGWPLPNTYYAKLGTASPDFGFGSRGWDYVWAWAAGTGRVALAPAALLAVSGARRSLAALPALLLVLAGARAVGLGLAALTGLSAGWTGQLWLVGLGALALVWPLAGLGRPEARLAGACWHAVAWVIAYAVAVGGDWMDGWRWLALASAPLAALTGLGGVVLADLFAEAAPPRWRAGVGWAAIGALGLGLAISGVGRTLAFARDPETSPEDVLARVRHTQAAMARLHVDRVVNLDVDMGAHLLWSGHELVDIAGLVDVPMAHHRHEVPFIREYVFEERRPHVAHLHDAWGRQFGAELHPEFTEGYLEIPGYPYGRTSLHVGNFIRRDLLLAPPTEAPARASLGAPVELVEWLAPAGGATAGESLFLELDLRGSTGLRRDDWRLIGFLASPWGVHAFDLPPGYDWLPPREWREGEVSRLRVAIPLPADLHPGRWDLGLVRIDGSGAVAVAEALDGLAEVRVDGAAFARGELVWPAAIEVLAPAAGADRLAAELAAVGDLAEIGQCADAEARWWVARALRAHDRRWVLANRGVVGQAIARCWLGEAERVLDRDEAGAAREAAVLLLRRARGWDHRVAGYEHLAGPLADELVAEGRDAVALGDWPLAYTRLADAVAVDPRRADARRLAERARDHRLGLDPRTRRRDRRRREAADALSGEGR